MDLAVDANVRGWWEDYADILERGYMDFIGLEAEAASVLQWQVETVPGLLQTREYAHCVNDSVQIVSLTAPGIIDRRTDVRMIRQRVLTEREPPLRLSVTVDESTLLRQIGGPDVMRAQLERMAELAELPNIELRVLPLRRQSPLMTSSFVIFGFSSADGGHALGDVVSLENMGEALSVDGESDTFQYRRLFESLTGAALSPDESVAKVRQVAHQVWRA
jgi:hypothetical protein